MPLNHSLQVANKLQLSEAVTSPVLRTTFCLEKNAYISERCFSFILVILESISGEWQFSKITPSGKYLVRTLKDEWRPIEHLRVLERDFFSVQKMLSSSNFLVIFRRIFIVLQTCMVWHLKNDCTCFLYVSWWPAISIVFVQETEESLLVLVFSCVSLYKSKPLLLRAISGQC